MRTTITLDADVAARIKAEMRRTGASFKEALNGLLRRSASAVAAPEKRPFKVRPFLREENPSLNYDNIGELLEQLEGPFHK